MVASYLGSVVHDRGEVVGAGCGGVLPRERSACQRRSGRGMVWWSVTLGA